jgi:hypothetical protein
MCPYILFYVLVSYKLKHSASFTYSKNIWKYSIYNLLGLLYILFEYLKVRRTETMAILF